MTHVLHICPKVDPAYMELLHQHHGWERKERPLLVDISRTTGLSKHETCPDCGAETEKMEKASPLDVSLLNSTIGSHNRPAQQYKQENIMLKQQAKTNERMEEMMKGITEKLDAQTKEIARLKGGKA